ncbi:MAG: prepilin-type N-terminal cleavage/methylation domain-containing protein [Candidatus Staskawiczbacteria bacterium]|nr:prepilin-type N-terminal cleavage/methylation domain-containing protein [Candidatus Staskawiczbacteria bacterium]
MNHSKAFTIIELIIVILIIAVLSGIVLVNVSGYIKKGKDSSIYGGLSTLIPAGEVFYTGSSNSFVGFCASSVVVNAISQMPSNPNANCSNKTVCCNDATAGVWAACVKEFVSPTLAYCVDSRGVEINTLPIASCINTLTKCN